MQRIVDQRHFICGIPRHDAPPTLEQFPEHILQRHQPLLGVLNDDDQLVIFDKQLPHRLLQINAGRLASLARAWT